jgi:hypothetical protein
VFSRLFRVDVIPVGGAEHAVQFLLGLPKNLDQSHKRPALSVIFNASDDHASPRGDDAPPDGRQ